MPPKGAARGLETAVKWVMIIETWYNGRMKKSPGGYPGAFAFA
jgi:hypothetical protein